MCSCAGAAVRNGSAGASADTDFDHNFMQQMVSFYSSYSAEPCTHRND